jgi:hypothetical protein
VLTALVQTITVGITNPDVVRNVVIKGAAATCAGNVVVTGTDYAGAVLNETIALSGVAVVVGVKAFATVTQIVLPVLAGAGDGVSVGVGSKLGLPYLLTKNTVHSAFINNVIEATAPTVAFDPVNISSNTVTLVSALAGTVVDVYLIVPA